VHHYWARGPFTYLVCPWKSYIDKIYNSDWSEMNPYNRPGKENWMVLKWNSLCPVVSELKWLICRRRECDNIFLFLLSHSAIFHSDKRNNSSWCLFRRFPRPQDMGRPSNSTQHTCHHPSTNRVQHCLTSVTKWYRYVQHYKP
jgi:hypothetical protein